MAKSLEPVVIILGVSKCPRANLAPLPHCRKAARGFHRYVSETLAVSRERVLYLFDTKLPPSNQLIRIESFLREVSENKNPGPTDLLLFYSGHGGFANAEQHFFLATTSTTTDHESHTSIMFYELARVLRNSARRMRRHVILDCCYAGSALTYMLQSTVDELVNQNLDRLPNDGTTLLCSSAAKLASIAPPGRKLTMFSEAFLHFLRNGVDEGGQRLSFNDLVLPIQDYVQNTFPDNFVRPELHKPKQTAGDPAAVPLFPNARRMERPTANTVTSPMKIQVSRTLRQKRSSENLLEDLSRAQTSADVADSGGEQVEPRGESIDRPTESMRDNAGSNFSTEVETASSLTANNESASPEKASIIAIERDQVTNTEQLSAGMLKDAASGYFSGTGDGKALEAKTNYSSVKENDEVQSAAAETTLPTKEEEERQKRAQAAAKGRATRARNAAEAALRRQRSIVEWAQKHTTLEKKLAILEQGLTLSVVFFAITSAVGLWVFERPLGDQGISNVSFPFFPSLFPVIILTIVCGVFAYVRQQFDSYMLIFIAFLSYLCWFVVANISERIVLQDIISSTSRLDNLSPFLRLVIGLLTGGVTAWLLGTVLVDMGFHFNDEEKRITRNLGAMCGVVSAICFFFVPSNPTVYDFGPYLVTIVPWQATFMAALPRLLGGRYGKWQMSARQWIAYSMVVTATVIVIVKWPVSVWQSVSIVKGEYSFTSSKMVDSAVVLTIEKGGPGILRCKALLEQDASSYESPIVIINKRNTRTKFSFPYVNIIASEKHVSLACINALRATVTSEPFIMR